MLDTGDHAYGKKTPDLALALSGGETVKLKDYAGQWLVLYFYPKDSTPGCTTEGLDFNALLPKFKKLGATRLIECWGDDVPKGEVTDFYKAVQAKEDETVIFSWIEYPDKATRDAANEKMAADSNPDMEMPFDAKRMFWGGFEPVVSE